mgnify:FL=1|jgi:hypothetical protein
MLTHIKTLNLGVVSISKHVVYHYKELNDFDDTKAIETTLVALQSKELERVHLPFAVNKILIESNDDPNGLQFWIHKPSSTIFTVLPKSNGKHVDMAMEANMDDFIFD